MTLHLTMPDGTELVITQKVLDRMAGFAQRKPTDPEASGLLIGHERAEPQQIILDRLTTPQPQDYRTRTRFRRDVKSHQLLLDQEWRLSGGKRTYLGEWHTHPEDDPKPSALDRENNRRIFATATIDMPFLVFIIVGLEKTRIWWSTSAQPNMHLLGSVDTPVIKLGVENDQEICR